MEELWFQSVKDLYFVFEHWVSQYHQVPPPDVAKFWTEKGNERNQRNVWLQQQQEIQ